MLFVIVVCWSFDVYPNKIIVQHPYFPGLAFKALVRRQSLEQHAQTRQHLIATAKQSGDTVALVQGKRVSWINLVLVSVGLDSV